MTFREVCLAIQGLRDRDLLYQLLLRRSTMIIASSGMAGSKVAKQMDKLWPVPKDNSKPSKDARALETLKRFRENEAKKEALKQHGRGSKNTGNSGRSAGN